MPTCSISVLIPVFNSEKIISHLIKSIIFYMKNDFKSHEYEIIIINDHSLDFSWKKIKDLCGKYRMLKGINLSKNYGQHNALMAGLNIAKGEKIITMDDDFQHHPSYIIKFLKKLDEWDACYTYYKKRKHNIFKKICSSLNNIVASFLIGKPFHLYMSSFRGFRKKVLNEIIKYKKNQVFIDYFIIKKSRKICMINIEHKNRLVGDSNYTIKKLLTLWCTMIICCDIFPLRLNTFFIIICKIIVWLFFKKKKFNEQFAISEKTF